MLLGWFFLFFFFSSILFACFSIQNCILKRNGMSEHNFTPQHLESESESQVLAHSCWPQLGNTKSKLNISKTLTNTHSQMCKHFQEEKEKHVLVQRIKNYFLPPILYHSVTTVNRIIKILPDWFSWSSGYITLNKMKTPQLSFYWATEQVLKYFWDCDHTFFIYKIDVKYSINKRHKNINTCFCT